MICWVGFNQITYFKIVLAKTKYRIIWLPITSARMLGLYLFSINIEGREKNKIQYVDPEINLGAIVLGIALMSTSYIAFQLFGSSFSFVFPLCVLWRVYAMKIFLQLHNILKERKHSDIHIYYYFRFKNNKEFLLCCIKRESLQQGIKLLKGGIAIVYI